MLRVQAFSQAQPRSSVRPWAAPRLSQQARLTQSICRSHNEACNTQQSQVTQQQPGQQSPSGPMLESAMGLVALAAALGSASPASAQVLDASQVHLLADVLRPTFTLFTFLYIVRIPMTWYPNLDGSAFPWNLAVTPTEPILSATRKVVPLVGGVDITPIVWVGLLSFFNEILLGPQGLLVLIERQGGL